MLPIPTALPFFFFFFNLIHSKCPYDTSEYTPAGVCYVLLKWHEIRQIRRDLWQEQPRSDSNIREGGFHQVKNRAEAMKMCNEIANIKYIPEKAGPNRTDFFKPNWTQIPGADVTMRLPMPATKEHLKWLQENLLFDPYANPQSSFRNRGQMWLGVEKSDSVDFMLEMRPTNPAPLGDPGECGYLFKAVPLQTQEHNGLYWLDCEDGVTDLSKKNMYAGVESFDVACEFDMPQDCNETSAPGCTVKWVDDDATCVKTLLNTVLTAPHRLGEQCKENGSTSGNATCDKAMEGQCRRDCVYDDWGRWGKCKPCKKFSGATQGNQTRKRDLVVRQAFGGAPCDGVGKETQGCVCKTTSTFYPQKPLVCVLILVAGWTILV